MKGKMYMGLYWFTVAVLFVLVGLIAYRLMVWPAVGETPRGTAIARAAEWSAP